MLNQLLIDMNEQLIESKKAVAMAIADEKKLERETAESAGSSPGVGKEGHVGGPLRSGRFSQGSPSAQTGVR